ncbi:IS630 family transposase [Rhizophagus clarus]|uniref:IS630 family transposase n=1 Tax=Rhizophagus clarus TaxID=94130 RepID=A0A8H3KUD7_9GLOM|nr:IS630 family transposase [Rhizophagus clarus]
MAKTKELSTFERERVIGFHDAGDSERTISRKTGYGKTTIHNIITKYHKTVVLTQNCRISAEKMQKDFIESTGKEVSKSTVRRTLYEMGYHSRTALRKPLISEPNRKIRLSWACERCFWTINDRKKVVWSDESRFTLFQSDKKIHVWRLPKESHDVNCLVPTIKHGGGGVMMWRCFSWYGLGPLVRINGQVDSERYVQEILGYHVIPFLEQFEEENGEYFFQQDNAPIHTSLRTRTFMEEVAITQLPWAEQSPDLNPIEHIWDELEHRIRARTNSPKNLGELESLLQECWLQIQREVYQKLVESMNRRIDAVIKARGYPTSNFSNKLNS